MLWQAHSKCIQSRFMEVLCSLYVRWMLHRHRIYGSRPHIHSHQLHNNLPFYGRWRGWKICFEFCFLLHNSKQQNPLENNQSNCEISLQIGVWDRPYWYDGTAEIRCWISILLRIWKHHHYSRAEVLWTSYPNNISVTRGWLFIVHIWLVGWKGNILL